MSPPWIPKPLGHPLLWVSLHSLRGLPDTRPQNSPFNTLKPKKENPFCPLESIVLTDSRSPLALFSTGLERLLAKQGSVWRSSAGPSQVDSIGFPEKCLLGKRGALALAPAQVAARCLHWAGHGRKRLLVNRKWVLQARGAVQVGSSREGTSKPRAAEWGAPIGHRVLWWRRVRWQPRRGWRTAESKGTLAPAGGCGVPLRRPPRSWSPECRASGKVGAENTVQRHVELRTLSSGKWEAALKEYLRKICCHEINCIVCRFLQKAWFTCT